MIMKTNKKGRKLPEDGFNITNNLIAFTFIAE